MNITTNNTITVVILTKDGAPFNKEGVDYVKDMIVKHHPELSKHSVLAMMGNTVFYPKQLYSLMTANPNLFVAVSYDGGSRIRLLNPKGDEKLTSMLYETAVNDPDITSWEVFAGRERGENHA